MSMFYIPHGMLNIVSGNKKVEAERNGEKNNPETLCNK